MFPIFSNMPASGFLAVLACVVGFGLFGWPGAVGGVVGVLAVSVWLEFRRARREERVKFEAHVARTRDHAAFLKRSAD